MNILSLIMICLSLSSYGVSVGTSYVVNDFNKEYEKTLKYYEKIYNKLEYFVFSHLTVVKNKKDFLNYFLTKKLNDIIIKLKKPSNACYWSDESALYWENSNKKINDQLKAFEKKLDKLIEETDKIESGADY